MTSRWNALAAAAGITLLGDLWLISRWGLLQVGMVLQLVGVALSAGISLWAARRDYRKTWPAAVALVCAAPLLQAMMKIGVNLIVVIQYVGLAALGMMVGSLASVVIALTILLGRMPPPPDERIARARIL